MATALPYGTGTTQPDLLEPLSAPSLAPSSNPSSTPSLFTTFASGGYIQTLGVLAIEDPFNSTQQSLFESQMENYTVEFGYNISAPEIVTKCTITNQDLGSKPAGFRRQRRTNFLRQNQTPSVNQTETWQSIYA